MIDNGGGVHVTNNFGGTPIDEAARCRKEEVFKMMAEAEAKYREKLGLGQGTSLSTSVFAK